MKKNRKLVASSIAGLSTFSIVAPIALIASSCSCSCSNGGESVLNGVHTPSFNTFTNDPLAAPKINVTTGENEYLKAASQNKKMPYEEYKWMWSCIAEYMKYGLGMISEQGLPDGMVKIENLNVKLSNFKFTSVKENRASYSVAGLIDVSLNIDSSKIEEWPEEYKWMKTLNGRVKLGWDHDVTNMPLGVFDIGTSNIKNAFNATLGNRFGEQGLEDLPWFDKTLWFIAPDMSQVAFNDPSWRLDYNFMVDADVELNDTKIVNGANNYNFKFDKTMAGTIEAIVESMSQSERSELIAYVIERFIPLAAGWMSYYLCNTQHFDHIVGIGDGLGWQTYHESNIAYTRLMQPALYKYELADPLDKSVPVDDQMMTFVIGLKPGDILDNLMKKQMPFTVVQSVDCKAEVKEEDGTWFLNATYDWANDLKYNRPEYGHTTADEPNGPAALIPIVMTKKWVSFGEPFILAEEKNFWDSYPAHNGQEGENTVQTMDAMGANKGQTTLTFGVSKEIYDDINKENAKGDYTISLSPVGQVQGQALASILDVWKTRSEEGQYYVDVPVGVEVWDGGAEPGATSAPFYVSISVEKEDFQATLNSGLFQLVQGNPIKWNTLCSAGNKNVQIPPRDNEITIHDAIECANDIAAETLTVNIDVEHAFVDTITATKSATTTGNFYDLNIKLNDQTRKDITNAKLTIEGSGKKVIIPSFSLTTKYQDIDWIPDLAFADQTYELNPDSEKPVYVVEKCFKVSDLSCLPSESYVPVEMSFDDESLNDSLIVNILRASDSDEDPYLNLYIEYVPTAVEAWDESQKKITLNLSWYDSGWERHTSELTFYVQKELLLKK